MTEEVEAEASLNIRDARLWLPDLRRLWDFCELLLLFLNIPAHFHLRRFGSELFRRQMAASKRQNRSQQMNYL